VDYTAQQQCLTFLKFLPFPSFQSNKQRDSDRRLFRIIIDTIRSYSIPNSQKPIVARWTRQHRGKRTIGFTNQRAAVSK
jgi:hypothetical protein